MPSPQFPQYFNFLKNISNLSQNFFNIIFDQKTRSIAVKRTLDLTWAGGIVISFQQKFNKNIWILNLSFLTCLRIQQKRFFKPYKK